MANPYHAITPIAGFNATRRDAAPEVAVGSVVLGDKNTIWVYGQASEAVTGTCTLGGAPGFLITDAPGAHTAEAAFAADEYGWVRQTAAASA